MINASTGPDRDDLLFGGLTALFLAVGAVLLAVVGPHPATVMNPMPPHATAVRFMVARAPAAPSGTAERQVVKAPQPVPVKPKPRKNPVPKPVPHELTPTAVSSEAPVDTAVPPPVVIPSTAQLELPAVLTAPVAAPAIPGSSALADAPVPPTTPPPSPDDDAPVNPFPVKPYGDTVVVAFKIDSDGHILDSTILVPSWNTLGDLSIRLAAQSNEAKSIRYTNINPPLQPGETRWIVIPHAWGRTDAQGSLP